MILCQDPLCGSSPCVLAGTISTEGLLMNKTLKESEGKGQYISCGFAEVIFFLDWNLCRWLEILFKGMSMQVPVRIEAWCSMLLLEKPQLHGTVWHAAAPMDTSRFLALPIPPGIVWDLSCHVPPKLSPQEWELLAVCESWGGHLTVNHSSHIPAWDWSLSYWFYPGAMLCQSLTSFN